MDSRINVPTLPVLEPGPSDIGIVGFPKSGHTWMQALIANLAYNVDPARVPDAVIQQLVPDMHWREPKRHSTPMFFKSHHLPRPEYRRVLYMLRDGRDVMVSYYHYLTALEETAPDFLTLARDGVPSWGHWHEHVEAWLANPFGADLLVLRYERLKTAPLEELARICEFTGLKRDDRALARAVQSCSFEKLKSKEARQGLANPAWPRDKSFFRRGQIGSHRDEMPTEVATAFLQNARSTMRKCGYVMEETSVGDLPAASLAFQSV
jgi:hypothetical protein